MSHSKILDSWRTLLLCGCILYLRTLGIGLPHICGSFLCVVLCRVGTAACLCWGTAEGCVPSGSILYTACPANLHWAVSWLVFSDKLYVLLHDFILVLYVHHRDFTPVVHFSGCVRIASIAVGDSSYLGV